MSSHTPESVLNLDESKILGYFESIHGVFLTKLVLLNAHEHNQYKKSLDPSTFPKEAINVVKGQYPYSLFFKALSKGNTELFLNLQDDLVTSTIISSWAVFEQITKDLLSNNYSQSSTQQSVNYENGIFQFTKREKKDLELFYYIRNSVLHYNGAYHAAKEIDHRYKNVNFISKGHIGEKIEADEKMAWDITKDLEKHSMKAWKNAKAPRQP